ncbi:hypothetical protein Tco_1128303, partial [Tanacetum coccineum]
MKNIINTREENNDLKLTDCHKEFFAKMVVDAVIAIRNTERFNTLGKEDWDGILASWMTEKWRKCSAAGVANRKKVPGDEEGLYLRHTHTSTSYTL